MLTPPILKFHTIRLRLITYYGVIKDPEVGIGLLVAARDVLADVAGCASLKAADVGKSCQRIGSAAAAYALGMCVVLLIIVIIVITGSTRDAPAQIVGAGGGGRNVGNWL